MPEFEGVDFLRKKGGKFKHLIPTTTTNKTKHYHKDIHPDSTLPPPNDNGDYGAEEVAKTFFSINSSTVPPHPPHRKDIYAPFQRTCLPAIGRAARLKPPPLYNL